VRAKIFLAGSWYQSHVPSASNPFAFRSLPHASPDSKGYDDLWDKCDKWRRIPNATEADAPFACSMRVPLSTLGFWALHAGLPFCCLAPLFVLWLAIYARKLYIGRVGDAVSQRRLRIDTNGSTVDASMATQNVVYATTIGGTLVGVTVAVAAVFFGLSALGYRLLVYPIPAHQASLLLSAVGWDGVHPPEAARRCHPSHPNPSGVY